METDQGNCQSLTVSGQLSPEPSRPLSVPVLCLPTSNLDLELSVLSHAAEKTRNQPIGYLAR